MRCFVLAWVVCVLLASCDSGPDYPIKMDRITNRFVCEMRQQQGLHLSGSGGGMMDDINNVSLYFDSKMQIGVDDARRLYVTSMETLLSKINADRDVRRYLHNFPFTVDNIRLSLSFCDRSGRDVSNGLVAHVFCIEGKVFYMTADSETGKSLDLYEESYDEALSVATRNPLTENVEGSVK